MHWRKFFDKLKATRRRSQAHKLSSPITSPPLGQETFFRYRKQRGVNLGSWFVLERWITDAPFCLANEPGQSDLDVAGGSRAREILEIHWDSWITEEDWLWLAQHGINSVRIPIGYYHLCGFDPTVLHNTDFRHFEDVFSGAWVRIVHAIRTAHRYDIGVLLDLHAAPGKQNNDPHSGTSLSPTFFTSKLNQEHTIYVLATLLRALMAQNPPLSNVIGIELLNEPHPPSDHALQKWYRSAIDSLRKINRDMPLVIGECWRPDSYAAFLQHQAADRTCGPLIMDHHLYRCFTSADIRKSVSRHIQELVDETDPIFSRVSQKMERVGGGFIIGEWSAALNPSSPREDGEVAEFVRAQLALYERYCSGWYWWTYKKKDDWKDTGWSFRDAVECGHFPSWVGLRRRNGLVRSVEREVDVRKEGAARALNQHEQYWSRYPGEYEHWRFEEGFYHGWDTAYLFFEHVESQVGRTGRVSELGMKGRWARSLTQDYGKGYWEFGEQDNLGDGVLSSSIEHGFFQGADAAVGHLELENRR